MIAAGIILFLLFGVSEVSVSMACTKCARYASRTDLGYEMPFLSIALGRLQGDVKINAQRNRQLSKLLDPASKCTHNWKEWAWGCKFVENRICYLGRSGDFARALFSEENDFDDFIADNPDSIPRIRESLSKTERFDDWLFDAYLEWSQAKCRETD